MKKTATVISLLTSFLLQAQILPFTHMSTYKSGVFAAGGTEIVSFDPASKRLFSTNGAQNKLDIINLSDISNPALITQIDLSTYNIGLNSVAVKNGIVAAVGEDATNPQGNGKVLFFDINGSFQKELTLGAMPDMATFTPSGNKLLTANEGEPNQNYTQDPEGSVSIIDLNGGVSNLTQSSVTTVSFSHLNSTNVDPLINNYGNNGLQTMAQDLEPEYITVNPAETKAFVSLQENNALMVIDLQTNTIDTVAGLGYINRSVPGFGIDASNEAHHINISTYTYLFGMYQPDAIASFEVNGQTYIASANEGDTRDYSGYSEEERIKNISLNSANFPNAALLQNDTVLGRLKITTSLGDNDGDGNYDSLFTFGGRSFSIWDENGQLVWDSRDDFEQILAQNHAGTFNSDNEDNSSYKGRSDDKGPEPEAIAVGEVNGVLYAFIGLERMGGIMIYDISNPVNPQFVLYDLNRDFSKPANDPDAGDLGPEGIVFVPSNESPTGVAMIIVSNEISGTISMYNVGYGLGAGENQAKILSVYPNPTYDRVNFTHPGNYIVYNTNGQIVFSVKEMDQIDLSEQPGGLYIIRDSKGNLARIVKR